MGAPWVGWLLEKNGLAINLDKCIFLALEIEFFGHQVNTEGISPTRQHVVVITAFPPPQDIKQLQQFLGMLNFFRCCLPNLARTVKPLTDALAGNPKKLDWSDDLQLAFQKAKEALVAAVPLAHPDPQAALA